MSLQKSKFLFKAAADETRLRILISRHFAYLRRVGLVTARKEGLWMYYRLAPGG